MHSYFKLALLTALICSAAASGAQAHPGSKILTTGSGERTAMTAGMQYEDVKGVHIFRGRPTAEEQASPKTSLHKQIEIEISVTPVYRRLRHLRTQGFYSGHAYLSRRYTHGFYSGR